MPNFAQRSRDGVTRALIALVTASVGLGLAQLASAPAASADSVPSCTTAGIGLTALGGPNFYIDSGSSPSFASSYTGYTVTNSTGATLADTWVRLSDFTGDALRLGSGQADAEQIASLGDGASAPLFWYLTAANASANLQGYTVTVYQHNPSLPTATALCTTAGGFSKVLGTLSASANKVTGISVDGGTPTLGSRFTVSVTGDTGQLGSGPSDNSDPYSFWMSPAVSGNWPAGSFRLVGTSLTISPDGTAAPQTYSNILRLANLGPTARDYTATYTFQAVGFTSSATTVQPVQEIASGTQVKHTGSYPATIPAIQPPSNSLTLALGASPAELDLGGGTAAYTATISGSAGVSLDSFTVTPPAGASFVAGSGQFDGSAIADPVLSNGTYVFSGPFTLTATSATLRFQLVLPSTPGDRVTALVGAVGSAVIDTTLSGTDSAPATATVNVDTAPTTTPISRTIKIDPVPNTVDLTGHVSDADGDPLTVVSVGDSTFGVTRLADGVITYTPLAEQPVADSFTYTISDGRGGEATGTVSITITDQRPQTITFPPLSQLTVGGTEQASATSDANLPVSYTSLTPEVCSVDSTGVISALSAGTCTIEADQFGDDSTTAAEPVTQSFTVDKKPQTITFPVLLDGLVGDTRTATASADSSLPVSYVSNTADVCSIDSDGLITTHSAGTCIIEADQPGDDTYAAADPITQSFTVTRKDQSINVDDPGPHGVLTGPVTLSATTDSGLPLHYASATPDVCSVDEQGAVTVLAAGTCTVTVSQDGDGTYLAESVPVSFTITPATQHITFSTPSRLLAGPTPLALDATTDSGLPVTYEILGGAGGCSVAGDQLTLSAAGTCTVRATAAGDGRYQAAAPAEVAITVIEPVDDAITLPPASGHTAPATLDVLGNDPSGLTITAVAHPTHGTATVSGEHIGYTPDAIFRGQDTFTYTVTDDHGRSATANVTVTLPDATPAARDVRVSQLAGSTLRVRIPATDPNRDALRATPTSPTRAVRVSATGTTVTITPTATVTGRVTITVVISDGAGKSVRIRIVDTVRPRPVAAARLTLDTTGTRISWARTAAAGARYEVRVNGAVSCTTTRLACRTASLLGPAARVTVTVLGKDRTRSTPRTAALLHGRRVLVATVYFATGSPDLDAAQRGVVARVARLLSRNGFTSVYLAGYTDAFGSAQADLLLSRHRNATVAAALRHDAGLTSRQDAFGKTSPVASSATPAGAARNRRVEIYVR